MSRSFTLVTADGRTVIANEQQHPDLFFALRGGGGNYGIVTEFTIQLRGAKRLLAGLLAFPIKQASQVIAAYTEVMHNTPDADALTTTVGLTTANQEKVLYINFVYYDDRLERGVQLLDKFLSFGTPLVNTVAQTSYFNLIEKSSDGAPFGRNYYLKTVNLASLSNAVVDRLIGIADRFSSPTSIIPMLHSRGAVSRNRDLDTAFSTREDHYMIEIIACWDGKDETERHIDWVEAAYGELRSFALPGGYVALMGSQESERVKEAFGANYVRLREVKRMYDPDDVFQSFGHINP